MFKFKDNLKKKKNILRSKIVQLACLEISSSVQTTAAVDNRLHCVQCSCLVKHKPPSSPSVAIMKSNKGANQKDV